MKRRPLNTSVRRGRDIPPSFDLGRREALRLAQAKRALQRQLQAAGHSRKESMRNRG